MSETLRKRRLRRTEGLIALFTADGKPAALLQLSLTSKLSVRRTDAQAGKGRISAGWREGSHTGWRRADVTHPLHTQRPPQDGAPSERVCLGYGGELIPAASTEVGNEIAMKRYFPEIERNVPPSFIFRATSFLSCKIATHVSTLPLAGTGLPLRGLSLRSACPASPFLNCLTQRLTVLTSHSDRRKRLARVCGFRCGERSDRRCLDRTSERPSIPVCAG